MANSVIHFPYIAVPTSSWFARTLLYWDAVGCVVPEEFDPNDQPAYPSRADRRWGHTQELIAAGLIRPVRPDRALRERGFLEGFERLLDTVQTEEPLNVRGNCARELGRRFGGSTTVFTLDDPAQANAPPSRRSGLDGTTLQ